MEERVFSILCAFISFIFSVTASIIIEKYIFRKNLKSEKYKEFYKQFSVIWDKIHQGRALDFYDLEESDRETIVYFLLENSYYAPDRLYEYIYQLKTSRLNNFDNLNDYNIEMCNDAYRKICIFMLNKEEKYRKKYTNIKY